MVPHRLALTQADVGQVIDAGRVKKRAEERHYLLTIISNVCCLARQRLAFQGTSGFQNDNFYQLLKLSAIDEEIIRCKLDKEEKNKMAGKRQLFKTFHHYKHQNEIIDLMANSMLRCLLSDIKEQRYYSLIFEEGTDCSNKNYMKICIIEYRRSVLRFLPCGKQ